MKVQSLTYSSQPLQLSPLRQVNRSKKPISALRKASPLKKEPCSKGLMTALFSKLARYSSLTTETRYGYYPGGTFILAPSSHAPPVPADTSFLRTSYPTPLAHTLTLKGEPKLCTTRRSISRERVGNRSTLRPVGGCLLASPKSLAIIGALATPRRPSRPLTARKAVVEGQQIRPKNHKLRFVRGSPDRQRTKKTEGITVIDVLIPSPKVRRSPIHLSVGSHLKTLSQQYDPPGDPNPRLNSDQSTLSEARFPDHQPL